MPLGTAGWISVALESLGVLAAFWGLLRVGVLNRAVGDPRLARLGLFFGLLAAALAASVAGAVALELRGVSGLREGFELLDVLFWAQHGFLVAAIAVAIVLVQPAPGRRVSPPRGPPEVALIVPPVVAAPLLALVAPLLARLVPLLAVVAPLLIAAEPILALLEGLGFLYLTLRTAVNHWRRASLGSLEVSFGFAFLLAASVLSLALSPLGAIPLGPPLVWAAGLELVAVLLFHGALPHARSATMDAPGPQPGDPEAGPRVGTTAGRRDGGPSDPTGRPR